MVLMDTTLFVVVAMGIVSLALALFLSRVVLGGLFRLAFHRARTFVRRVFRRRQADRGEPDRRHVERRR